MISEEEGGCRTRLIRLILEVKFGNDPLWKIVLETTIEEVFFLKFLTTSFNLGCVWERLGLDLNRWRNKFIFS